MGSTLLLLSSEEETIQLLGGEDDTESTTAVDPAESMLTMGITEGTFVVRSMLTHIHLPLP